MKSNIKGQASVKIKAPATKVWDALTKPEIIKRYFFGTNTVTDWKVGNPIKFYSEYEGKKYEDKGTVLAFEPQKLIRYEYWSSLSGIEDKPENYVTITYKVTEESDGTKLEITQENIPDEKTKGHSEANWQKVLGSLKSLLEREGEVPAF